jgi:hypothetical protein
MSAPAGEPYPLATMKRGLSDPQLVAGIEGSFIVGINGA